MQKNVAAVVIILLLGSEATAERPVQPRTSATHIVTGTVFKVFTHDGAKTKEYVVQIAIESIEKGDNYRKADMIYAYAFQRKPNAPREPSAGGHSAIPKRGQRIKAWINRGFGQMEGVYPNWFDVLGPRDKKN